MKFQLFEVASTFLYNMKPMTIVLFFLFAIIVVGYLLGKFPSKELRSAAQLSFLLP